MTRIRISHSWRTIRGAHIRIVHRRRVAVKSDSSITGWIVPSIVISFRSWVAPSHGKHSPLSASLTEVF